ncbi:unnamed protein product [Moneuplotes crassus]|uniref:Uncharacterized protein n=1 Tax=Euplotes crassus TaxID=5936 RepID=A0AAD2CXL5_EUPCR|nr:unnamed protein product [Moneuplotes crassus]|mmetsp:Transcript_4748/g.4474  ORF Transcript_4748/g.4474 Transcript_4748/m.4474 type:complete len:369 (-) Transcript_4748:34-1140(-)|eukprot:CAMPEP_0196994650 /NCGR_PEP_ID=MMETSP1380-20130617/913_1 /TAXON_ID=5936 /ORGANISM="Euplotes crassus, Strain CT5" /LENGTH=368 /DNA_ID=CAMNT_0042410087 /DNA_START=11 /DNA_END=1117 /DNA_ORIENTATION=+
MKLLILSILFVTLAVTTPLTSLQYKTKYGSVIQGDEPYTKAIAYKMYGDFLDTYEDLTMNKGDSYDRFEIFNDNMKKVIAHNKDTTKTWKMGVNKFQDMTDEEFKIYFSLDITSDDEKCSATASPRINYNGDTDENFSWREIRMPHSAKVVTPVKDQGHCGSCWAFSTIGAMESHFLITTTKYAIMSEQQLVDCAGDFDNHGCNGGLPENAFRYISENGLTFEGTYPYVGQDQKCKYDPLYKRITAKGPFVIEEGNEEQLVESIRHAGPVSVAYQVVDDFRFYESGVYSSNDCENTKSDVNHAVLATGYGVETGLKYYEIKNSWGSDWGDEGFFKIERDQNMCGIAVCNSYPLGVSSVYGKSGELIKN